MLNRQINVHQHGKLRAQNHADDFLRLCNYQYHVTGLKKDNRKLKEKKKMHEYNVTQAFKTTR